VHIGYAACLQLSSQKVLQLLQAAVEHANGGAVMLIRGLPSAKQLCSSSMAQLEEMAAEKGFDMSLWAPGRVVRY
jgi:hypothetical protein